MSGGGREHQGVRGLVALVTGAGTGLGRSMAAALAHGGSHVILCGRRAEMLEEAAATITGEGGSCIWQAFDITDEAALSGLARTSCAIDVLVNNAAISPLQPWDRVSPEDFRTVLRTNLEAPFRLIQLLAPGMIARGFGRIVNITSIYGLVGGNPRLYPGIDWDIPAYVAAKSALTGLTRHLAVRFARNGVTVNAIAPGPFETPLAATKLTAGVRAELEKAIPLGRLGKPEEIAAAILFLASREAGYVTGQVIGVEGGWTAW